MLRALLPQRYWYAIVGAFSRCTWCAKWMSRHFTNLRRKIQMNKLESNCTDIG